jgi:hypothetical protein
LFCRSAPLIIVTLLWCILITEHIVYLGETAEGWEIRFQALYVRIVGIFPIFAVLGYVGVLYPYNFHWFELAGVFLEIYALFGFYALLTGLAYIKSPTGVFPDNLLNAKWTDRPFICCSYRFRTGNGALTFFFCQIGQFAIIKPALVLVSAIIFARTGSEPPLPLKLALNAITAISIFLATIAVLRIYKGLLVQPVGYERTQWFD